jgi:hypothetical protein
MIRQARTGDIVLVKSREITGRSQTLSWWRRGEGVKTTENKIHSLRAVGWLGTNTNDSKKTLYSLLFFFSHDYDY